MHNRTWRSPIENTRFLPLALSVLLGILSFHCFVPLYTSSVLAQTPEFQQSRADSLIEQGLVRHKNADFTAALTSFEQALEIYESLGNLGGIANALKIIGNTYFSMGRYARAVEFYQQSLRIMQLTGNRQGEAEVLAGLSNAHFYLGNELEAKEFEQQAQALRQVINSSRQEAAFLSSLSLDYEAQGKHQQSIDAYQRQLILARELGDRVLESNTLDNLAQAYESLGQYQQAIEVYLQQLKRARMSSDRILETSYLNHLAQAYQSLGQHQQALEFYQQKLAVAREIHDSKLEADALNQIAVTYESLAQYPQAIEIRTQQLEMARKASDRIGEGTALNHIATGLFKSGNFTQAQATLLEALKIWEAIPTKPNSNSNNPPEQTNTYNLLQQVLIGQNQPAAALEISERQKVSAIAQLFNKSSVALDGKPIPNPISFPNISKIQQIAKAQKATIVEYSIVSETEIYIWVIQPQGGIAFRPVKLNPENTLYPITSISSLVVKSWESIGLQPPSTTTTLPTINQEQPLLQLYQLLIKPIAEILPQSPKERVIFIPHQELSLVPFPALVDIIGKSLIEKHTILTAPAIEILSLTKQQRQRVGGRLIVAVGNTAQPSISTSGEPLIPSPSSGNADREVVEIAKLFHVKPLIGNQITKGFLLPILLQARIVHFSTSGSLGGRGAIALSPSDKDNGILTADEILNLPLKAELVVLNIKDMEMNIGDGVNRLALSLISAGVPSVITPIASVSDPATAYLMIEFYRQFKRTGDKAEALRQSAINTMKQYPNSKAWAAFTLIGEAR